MLIIIKYILQVYFNLVRVSHLGEIKHKTLFVKIELNAFSYRGHMYGHFKKKIIQIPQNLTKW